MIAIKSDAMKQMPEYCDDCVWYGSRPHPCKGWTELCELMGHCMDDDQEEEWIYDGNSRPKACPLLEVDDIPQTACDNCAENGSYKCTKCDGEMYYRDVSHTDCDTCRHYKLACELFSEICKYEPKADAT